MIAAISLLDAAAVALAALMWCAPEPVRRAVPWLFRRPTPSEAMLNLAAWIIIAANLVFTYLFISRASLPGPRPSIWRSTSPLYAFVLLSIAICGKYRHGLDHDRAGIRLRDRFKPTPMGPRP